MQVVGYTNINRINVISSNQFAPIRFDRFIPPLIGKLLSRPRVTSTGSFQDRAILEVKNTSSYTEVAVDI